jgi:predicted RND superfamily exporter protein
MAGDLLSRMHALRGMSNPEPPRLTDLPEGLTTRFVGTNNKLLLKVYSKESIWDMDKLERFVRQVRSVDPAATGQPLQTYFASRQMQRSYVAAAGYALLAVTVVLLLDFASIGYALLAIAPVGLGMVQMFGIMGWLDIPLNPANMIVLPLILGIGLDDGVHVVHDLRAQRGRYRLSSSTATAVVITSLTTMVGFGSLMIAEHRGLQSLGRVLTIGVSCCMVSSIVVLPALLTWITRRRDAGRREDSQSEVSVPAPLRPAAEMSAHRRRTRQPDRLDPAHEPAPVAKTTRSPTSR